MKQLFILTGILLAILAGLSSCSSSERAAGTTLIDPIPRVSGIGSELEWNQFKDQFAELKSKLEANEQDHKSAIEMASLLVREARITGHYAYYYDGALALLNKSLDDPEMASGHRFDALSVKGIILLAQHRFHAALKVGKEAVAINNFNAAIYGVMCDAAVELGKYEDAIQYSSRMQEIRPDLRSYSRLGYVFEIHGDIDGAFEGLERAVQAGYPGSEEWAWCKYNLGKLHERYGNLSDAETHYHGILAARPQYPFATAALGDIELKKGNTDQVAPYYRAAWNLMKDPAFVERLARFYHHTNQHDSFQVYLKAAIAAHGSLEDHGHEHGLELARIRMELGNDLDAALKTAEHEAHHRPKNIDVNALLAELHLRMGNYDKANQHMELALATGSMDPGVLLIAGHLAWHANDQAKATATLQKSLQTNPFQTGQLAEQARAWLAGDIRAMATVE